jgi:peptidoglycan hydrolase-like protein with peptidoglycan-binding domain
MMPMLSLGSFGDAVKTLQGSLNLWPQRMYQLLAVDGAFGKKTDTAVRQFQGGNALSQDGYVGPQTWAALKPLIDALLASLPVPANDLAAGEQIATVAETAYGMFGWSGGSVKPNPFSAQIAAAICAAPTDPTRPRQGGVSLLQIFQLAGAPGNYVSRCLTITQAAVAKWQEVSAEATAWRNNNDLPAWCGIFCYYIYRCAGINLGGWVSHKTNVSSGKLRKILSPADAFRGCIGVEDGVRPGGRNHHFLVMNNNKDGVISSIDGNSFGPVNGDFSTGLKSVIARKTYTYSTLKSNSAYFLFPDLSKL